MTYTSTGYGVINNPVLDKVLSNGTTSWQIANEYLVGFDSNISVKLKKIAKGVGTFFFIVEYTNTTSQSSLGEYIFAIGSNQNGQAALLTPPYLLSEPELLYIYTSAGKSENPFKNKSIKQMVCVYSCLILTDDGLIYQHAGEDYNHYATGRWYPVYGLPTSYTDPDSSTMLNNVLYQMVAVGGTYGSHTYFALTNYGHVFSFGKYNEGARGTPSTMNEDVPTLIPGLRNITFIAANPSLTSDKVTVGAIDETGNLWTWGSNYYGQMGVNNATLINTEYPQQVPISNVKTIVFGYTHLIIILKDGEMYGCGTDSNSEVTGIPSGYLYLPTLIAISEKPVECSSSLEYTACIMTDGKLYTWGRSEKVGHSDQSYYLATDVPNGENTTHVEIIDKGALAFTSALHSVVWGTSNVDSIGGLGDEKQVRYPTKLTTPAFFTYSNITYLKATSSDTCTFLLAQPNNSGGTANTLNYWGPCDDLYFSEQNIYPYNAPSLLTDQGVVDISYTSQFSLALTSDGTVYGWGTCSHSSMGLIDSVYNNPTPIYSGDIKLICAGSSTTLILLKNGTLLGVGYNSMGELGLGHSSQVSTFTAINTTFLGSEKIVDVKAGSELTFLLTDKGNVYGCGTNNQGYISSSSDSYFTTFVLVSSTFKIKKISASFYHFLMVISTSGDAYYFSAGMIKFSLPSNDSHVVDVFGFSRSFYLITKRGSVYTSGLNTYYQVSPQKALDEIVITLPKLYVSKYDLDGIPYAGVAGNGRAILITRYEYTCNGINSTDENVCSSKGSCSGPDQCDCLEGYSGSNCQNYYCDGIEKSNSSFVCSGRGICTSPNVCSCNNSNGTNCEYSICYGISQNDTTNVCGGKGMCTAFNTCVCSIGYFGEMCQHRSCFSNLSNGLKYPSAANIFCQRINKYLK